MLDALYERLADAATWARPAGGMFVFLELREPVDVAIVLERAMSRGIVFVPGASFYPDGRGANTLRLNFVSESPERIRTGVETLSAVIRETVERRWTAVSLLATCQHRPGHDLVSGCRDRECRSGIQEVSNPGDQEGGRQTPSWIPAFLDS